MATQQTATAGRVLVAPSVILFFLWMIVPLVMTIYFSVIAASCLHPDDGRLHRAAELHRLSLDPDFLGASSTRWFWSSCHRAIISVGGGSSSRF